MSDTILPFTYTIGLEIHVQLKTKSKMFCRCSNEADDRMPNTTVCPVCMGHPGTLPVVNEDAVRWGVKTSLALNCTINEISKFDRKNYFYPDLPKGYQISQYDRPVGIQGHVDIAIPAGSNRTSARIRINRLHLEEDAAKLMHAPNGNASLVDFNRACTPLMEIVTEPDFISPVEAKIFLQDLRLLARYLDVSYADMEKGHMRCDANISINILEGGTTIQTPISEIKNLNSFRAVERALEFEGNRLFEEWQAGGEIRQRNYKITIGWDNDKQETVLQRWKEEAHDYRYFPEPDIPPLHLTDQYIAEIRTELPELPAKKRERLIKQYGISEDDARILVEDKELVSFFEHTTSELDSWLCSLSTCDDAYKQSTYRLLSSFIVNRFIGILDAEGTNISDSKATPENIGQIIALLAEKKINTPTANVLLQATHETGIDPVQMMTEQGLEQINDSTLIESTCKNVIQKNPDAVANFKGGKQNALMFLVGQAMKELKGKGQPDILRATLEKLLS